jgi:hypothetical protein
MKERQGEESGHSGGGGEGEAAAISHESKLMSCCSERVFERHADPDIADIGKAGGVEYTVGRCRNCGAVLIHCWAGGVVEGYQVVSQALIDHFTTADPALRNVLLAEWFNSLT